MSKRLIALLILILLILTLLGLAGVYFYQQREKGEEEASPSQAEEEEEPAEEEEEVEEEPEEADETATWKTYTNNKYQYSFKYPADFTYGPCTTKPCPNFVYDQLPGYTERDYVLLQGAIATKGWPNISVTHYDTTFYNPPAGTDLVTWLKANAPSKEYVPDETNTTLSGLPAVKVSDPGSPQAYSSDTFYVLKDGKLFEIMMLDVVSPEAQAFYNLFLPTFQFE